MLSEGPQERWNAIVTIISSYYDYRVFGVHVKYLDYSLYFKKCRYKNLYTNNGHNFNSSFTGRWCIMAVVTILHTTLTANTRTLLLNWDHTFSKYTPWKTMYYTIIQCLQVWREIYQFEIYNTLMIISLMKHRDDFKTVSELICVHSEVRHFFNLGFHLPPLWRVTKHILIAIMCVCV